MAATNGHEAVVARLLAPGVGTDPNQAMTDTATPLLMAAMNGHEAVAKLLLAGGADRTVRTQYGTAAELAARNGHAALAELLRDVKKPSMVERPKALKSK